MPGWTWAYPWIMLLAIAIGFILLRRNQREMALRKEQKLAIGLGAFCGAMIFAKLPFLFVDWESFRSGTVWISGGKTIVCGMVGAYFGVEIAKWICSIQTKTGDSFAVPAAVSVGIGRLSCLVAGCCYGSPTTLPWGIGSLLADDGLQPRHPTQLYEAIFHFSIAAWMAYLQPRGFWRGQWVKLYIIVYLVYRWMSEFVRPEPAIAVGMTFYQWFAIAFVPVFLALWWRDANSMKSPSMQAS